MSKSSLNNGNPNMVQFAGDNINTNIHPHFDNIIKEGNGINNSINVKMPNDLHMNISNPINNSNINNNIPLNGINAMNTMNLNTLGQNNLNNLNALKVTNPNGINAINTLNPLNNNNPLGANIPVGNGVLLNNNNINPNSISKINTNTVSGGIGSLQLNSNILPSPVPLNIMGDKPNIQNANPASKNFLFYLNNFISSRSL